MPHCCDLWLLPADEPAQAGSSKNGDVHKFTVVAIEGCSSAQDNVTSRMMAV